MSRRPLRLLISSGPTREPIDPVRFLSNYSTGFMGACLAAEALKRGHTVRLVTGPTALPMPKQAQVIWVEQARQMQEALQRHLPKADALIMAAAVCDFQPVRLRREKLPRQGRLTLSLQATPDIVGSLRRRIGQLVVGFALESPQGLERARTKLKAKRLDLIVGQQVNGKERPFGKRKVSAFFLDASGRVRQLGRVSKRTLARELLDEIEALWYRRNEPRRRTTYFRTSLSPRSRKRPAKTPLAKAQNFSFAFLR